MDGSEAATDSRHENIQSETEGSQSESTCEQRESPDVHGSAVPTIYPRWVIIGIFVLGMCCTFSFRVLMVLEHLQPSWVRPVWYFGVLGYVLFFYYQYKVSKRRRQTVKEFDLIDSLRNNEPMSEQQRQAATYVLKSVTESRERINYYVIYILSAMAVAADIILSFWE
jgi:amino acid permease